MTRPEASAGEGGIRTHGEVSPTHAFQACSFSHSDTSPWDALGVARLVQAAGMIDLASRRVNAHPRSGFFLPPAAVSSRSPGVKSAKIQGTQEVPVRSQFFHIRVHSLSGSFLSILGPTCGYPQHFVAKALTDHHLLSKKNAAWAERPPAGFGGPDRGAFDTGDVDTSSRSIRYSGQGRGRVAAAGDPFSARFNRVREAG